MPESSFCMVRIVTAAFILLYCSLAYASCRIPLHLYILVNFIVNVAFEHVMSVQSNTLHEL